MINLATYLEILELEVNNNIDLEIISIINDIPIDEVEEMRQKDINNILKQYKYTLETKKLKYTIIIDGKTYNLRDNLKLTFGEYVDLETYIKDPKTWSKVIELYYGIETEELDIIYVNGIVNYFIEFDILMRNKYPILFDYVENDDDVDKEQQEFKHPTTRLKEAKEKQHSENQKSFGWLPVIFELAKYDITKINDVTNQNVILVFNVLSLIKVNKIQLNPLPTPNL